MGLVQLLLGNLGSNLEDQFRVETGTREHLNAESCFLVKSLKYREQRSFDLVANDVFTTFFDFSIFFW